MQISKQATLANRMAGHPTGLRVLFFTEMWERFSYYGMRALLVIYLVNALGYSRQDALALYGIYTGLVYFTPLIGGVLADQYVGQRRAVVIGGILMVLGHIAMAFDGWLYEALALLIVGNGFFKPNASAMVGGLYPDSSDARRAGAYSIFYMGINLGAFLAPIVTGWLAEDVGWHYGFAAAAVGMTLGLSQLFYGQRHLERVGLRPGQTGVGWQDVRPLGAWVLGSAGLALGGVQAWGWVSPWFYELTMVKRVFGIVALGVLVMWVLLKPSSSQAAQPLTRQDWRKVIGLLIASCFVMLFWAAFEQKGGSMSLFVDQQTDRQVGGFVIPTSWFQSINPLGIVLMAPVFSMFWVWLDNSRWAVSDVVKQGLGMVVLGLGCVLMVQVDVLAQVQERVNPLWVVAVLMLFTAGELMLSPVGLSLVSRVAPIQILSLMMGCWLLVAAIANYFAGILEHFLQGSGWPLYTFLATMTIGCGLLLVLLSPWLNRLMQDDEAQALKSGA
jgi:POT family proton-dependent oligopeptide transporter